MGEIAGLTCSWQISRTGIFGRERTVAVENAVFRRGVMPDGWLTTKSNHMAKMNEWNIVCATFMCRERARKREYCVEGSAME